MFVKGKHVTMAIPQHASLFTSSRFLLSQFVFKLSPELKMHCELPFPMRGHTMPSALKPVWTKDNKKQSFSFN